MAEVHGYCDERFAPLGDLFRTGFERGSDEGASLAVTMDDRLVVDLWGGYRDLAHTKPWEPDTVVWVASTSKVIVAIATLMVWDRGLIDLDEPVATYWPEFARAARPRSPPDKSSYSVPGCRDSAARSRPMTPSTGIA